MPDSARGVAPDEARNVIERISAKLGEPPDRIRAQFLRLDDDGSEYVDELRAERRKNNEKLIRFATKDIYTDGLRYLYELIQNADDLDYFNTRSLREQPKLHFILTREHLIIDNNENGFKVANVQALCAISESSKKINAGDESIGEKGIGFKSIFAIAQEVHVQSGHWSFGFENRREDPLSIIIPKLMPHQDLPPGIQTRIKIRYHESSRDRIVEDLRGLSHGALMFLRNISHLTISFDPQAAVNEPQRSFSMRQESLGSITCLETRVGGLSGNATARSRYQVHRRSFTMPADEDHRSTTTEVQLAFPIAVEARDPCISPEGEHVYAFLPMHKKPEFPFIIQADFLTNNSREHVVSCPWNNSLRRHVAEAFVSGIRELISAGLTQDWLLYLPCASRDPFWAPLSKDINALLQTQDVLQRAVDGRLTSPSMLVLLPDCFVHNGKPLLSDNCLFKQYLDPTYTRRESFRTKLMDIGVKPITWSELLRILCRDCESEESRRKAIPLSDDWHSSFAMFIRKALEVATSGTNGWIKNDIQRLPIIPLEDGSWTKPAETVYFHEIDDQIIPTNLGLRLLRPVACGTGEQRSFYIVLGVSDCRPKYLGDRIMEFQLSERAGSIANSYTMALHLRFLHYEGRDIAESDRRRLIACTSRNKWCRAERDLYFPSDKEHDAQCLVDKILSSGATDDSFSGHVVLHKEYFSIWNATTFHHGRTWEQWLRYFLGVRYFPRLIVRVFGGLKLSPILDKICKLDSVLFLAVLQQHWVEDYSLEIRPYQHQLSHLSHVRVQCVNGVQRELNRSFFPSPDLLKHTAGMGIDKLMPFLKLPSPSPSPDEWDFLMRLNVHFDDDLDFWLEALSVVKDATTLSPLEKPRSVQTIYESIGRLANKDSASKIKGHFDRIQGVCNPKNASDWRAPKECFWKGPNFIYSKIVLHAQYKKSEAISSLFKSVLCIKDATVRDLIAEVSQIKQDETWREPAKLGSWTSSANLMTAVYLALDSQRRAEATNTSEFRALLEQKLIFVRGSWYEPSDCVWDFALNDAGTPRIQEVYGSLQSFFVDFAGVPTVDAVWIVERLQSPAKNAGRNVEESKKLILELGARIAVGQVGNQSSFLEHMKKLSKSSSKFLPVSQRGNRVVHRGINDGFFIVNDDGLANKFKDHIDILDFDAEASSKLHWLFAKLSLEERYLTRQVKTLSEPSSSELHEPRTTDFQQRSYAFSCCAARFTSRLFIGDKSTHERLREAKVYTSANFRTQLQLISADGEAVTVDADRSVPTISAVDGGEIKIYLPAEERALQRCYRISMPGLLRDLLEIEDVAAERWLEQLLTQPLGGLYQILQDAQIPLLSWIESNDFMQESHPDVHTLPASEPLHLSGQLSNVQDSLSSQVTHTLGSQMQALPIHTEQGNRLTFSPSSEAPSFPVDCYPRLLRQLLNAIRQQSEARVPQAADVLSAADIIRLQQASTNQIGAVGELYLYERLRALNLPSFGHHVWQSRIRSLVKRLDEYRDMPDFFEPDMDIVVNDDSGRLEQWLRRQSYNRFPDFPVLDDAFGRPRKVTFEFEVKSTFGPCSRTLYMSHNQYQRMHAHRIVNIPETGKVFVLVRAFDLLKPQPQMCIFVDPARLEGTTLRFTTNHWKVQTSVRY